MITPPFSSSSYGMGFSITYDFFDRPFAYHQGRFRDYLAFNGVFLDNGFSISLLITNANPTNENPVGQIVSFVEGVYGAVCFQSTAC